MRQSLYIKIATFFIRAELHRESREWKARLRRSSYDIPWESKYLLQDIGLEQDGRPIGTSEPEFLTAERKARHLRRIVQSRMVT